MNLKQSSSRKLMNFNFKIQVYFDFYHNLKDSSKYFAVCCVVHYLLQFAVLHNAVVLRFSSK